MKPGSTLIVCFDGLRRDRARPDLMPNLCTFMATGTDFVNARSVFPSETRVAVTSTVTGCPPAAHGLVANQFLHPAVPGRPFQTARAEDLMAAAAMGQLIDRPSLGERLAIAGRKMAVVSTASPGATWMLHPMARELGHPVFSVHGRPIGTEPLQTNACAILGDIPSHATPNGARLDYAVNVLIEVLWPAEDPDLCVVWLSDPDSTSHAFGVHAPETEAAQRAGDAAFGKILRWWREGRGPENVMVMSDHGQITGKAEVNLSELLPQWQGRLSPGATTGIYLSERKEITDAVRFLAEQPFTGLIFADDIPGALPWSLTGNGHPRGPRLAFTLRATPPDAAEDACMFPGYIPVGGGFHGGLHRGELSTVLAGAGPAFREKHVSETPCWLPDIAPTLLFLFGLPTDGTDGRVLTEALVGGAEAPEVHHKVVGAEIYGHEQHLSLWLVGERHIIDCGWTSGRGSWDRVET